MPCGAISCPALLNVVLDYIYIFPLGMGIEGAGIATFLSCMAGALMVIGYLVFGASTLGGLSKIKSLPQKPAPQPAQYRRAVQYRHLRTSWRSHNGHDDADGQPGVHALDRRQRVSAFSIVCYYCPCVFMIGNAIAQSAQPIASFQLQCGRPQAGGRHRATGTSVGPRLRHNHHARLHHLPTRYGKPLSLHDSEAAAIAVNGFPVFSAALIFFVFNLTAIGYFQSVKKSKAIDNIRPSCVVQCS